ncbi:MAG: ribonuclease P protein component [Lachnospiraceae bacterium]|nr:ribonuclease P protein component [Lachnospiraceae bacterium]
MKDYVSLKNREFSKVYKTRKSKANHELIVYAVKNDLEYNRLGISVSKKIGNSVVRHRFCRLVRECYRSNRDNMKQGYDIVVIARPEVIGLKCQSVNKSFRHLLHKHHLLEDDE